MANTSVELKDPSMLEKYKKELNINFKNGLDSDLCHAEDGFAKEILPEDIMAKLEELTGNGEGRVTVAGELGTNEDYGQKASAFFSVSVNCDSSLDSIHGGA